MDVNETVGESVPGESAPGESAPGGLDLSPRQPVGGSATIARRPKRKRGAYILLALVLVVGVFIVGKGLTSAIDYYCNADEVGVVDKCSGERSVRIQGAVDEGSIVTGPAGSVDGFTISFNGRSVPVDYTEAAAVPGLFQACIPVIVAGSLQADGELLATGVEVKHSDEYEKKNADRIDQAESAACAQKADLEASE